MNRDSSRKTSGTHALQLLILALSVHGETPTVHPNIVLILADDLGRYQLGCYGSGFYETPNIDRLAREGMRFTNAYAASPVCSPTRASIMTGKHPARLRLTNFLVGGSPQDRKLLTPEWAKYLPPEEVSIAESLRASGYTTAHFGKWHLGKHPPDEQGFDRSLLTYKPREGRDTPGHDAHNVQRITRESMAFMEKNREHPFFLLVSHNSIHTPLMESEALIGKFKDKAQASLPENRPLIGAMLQTLDESIGAILDKLKNLGLADNTMVIFFSDNGHHGPKDFGPLRGSKGDLYEGGIRMPLVARWPGIVPNGSICDEVVISNDFFPTFNEIAGVSSVVAGIDGTSLLPILRNPDATLGREAVHWHFPHYHGAGLGPQGAIRAGPYKLIEWFEKSAYGEAKAFELYNLVSDPGEKTNLAEDKPEVTARLRSRLEAWRKHVGAQMMTRRK